MLNEKNVTRLENTLQGLTLVDLRLTTSTDSRGWTVRTTVEFVRGFCDWVRENQTDVTRVTFDGETLWTRS